MELHQLRVEVEELKTQNRNLVELERAAKSEMLFFRKKAEKAEQHGGQLEYVAKQAKMRAIEVENILTNR